MQVPAALLAESRIKEEEGRRRREQGEDGDGRVLKADPSTFSFLVGNGHLGEKGHQDAAKQGGEAVRVHGER